MGVAAGITADTVRQLPKAELHLHLDSGFEVEDAVRLATENRVPLLKEPADAMFEWDDLQDFLTFLDWVLSLPRNAEQVASLSYSVARRQGRSGVSYTDLMVSPIHWEELRRPARGVHRRGGVGTRRRRARRPPARVPLGQHLPQAQPG